MQLLALGTVNFPDNPHGFVNRNSNFVQNALVQKQVFRNRTETFRFVPLDYNPGAAALTRQESSIAAPTLSPPAELISCNFTAMERAIFVVRRHK